MCLVDISFSFLSSSNSKKLRVRRIILSQPFLYGQRHIKASFTAILPHFRERGNCHGKSSFLSRQIFIFALLLPLPFFFSLLPFGREKGKGRIFLSFFFLKRKYRKRREKDYFSEDREGEKGKRGKEKRGKEKTLEEKRKKLFSCKV